jgi:hypothetical protein
MNGKTARLFFNAFGEKRRPAKRAYLKMNHRERFEYKKVLRKLVKEKE